MQIVVKVGMLLTSCCIQMFQDCLASSSALVRTLICLRVKDCVTRSNVSFCAKVCCIPEKELKWPQHSNQTLRNRQSSSAKVALLVSITVSLNGDGVIQKLPCSHAAHSDGSLFACGQSGCYVLLKVEKHGCYIHMQQDVPLRLLPLTCPPLMSNCRTASGWEAILR